MEDMIVMKGPGGVLVPATESDAEKIKKYKLGQGIRVKTTAMSPHNYLFHKKCFVLVDYVFDVFIDRVDTGVVYKDRRGVETLVKPSRERFRDDFTILAGHYDATYGINGDVRLEPKSWSYAKMSDEQKDSLYSDLIDTALRMLTKYQHSMRREQLDEIVEGLMRFDG